MSMKAKISPQSEAGDFMSTADAAKLLFVSRPHVLRLVKQGKLKLHHKAGNDRLVEKASVLAYLADLPAAEKAYQSSTPDEE